MKRLFLWLAEKHLFPTSVNLVLVCGQVGPAKPCWLFLFLTLGICSRHYSYVRDKCLRDSCWHLEMHCWDFSATVTKEHMLFLQQSRPVDSHTTLAELAEAWVIWRLFKALLKCVVTWKFYIDHHYMLIIILLLEVWNASDFNQKSCGEYSAKYCWSD